MTLNLRPLTLRHSGNILKVEKWCAFNISAQVSSPHCHPRKPKTLSTFSLWFWWFYVFQSLSLLWGSVRWWQHCLWRHLSFFSQKMPDVLPISIFLCSWIWHCACLHILNHNITMALNISQKPGKARSLLARSFPQRPWENSCWLQRFQKQKLHKDNRDIQQMSNDKR